MIDRSLRLGAAIVCAFIVLLAACTGASPERKKVLERTLIVNDEMLGKVRFEYGIFSNRCPPKISHRIEYEVMKNVTGDENGYDAAADWFLALCRDEARDDTLMSSWAWGVTAHTTYEDARIVCIKIDEMLLMNGGRPNRSLRYVLFDLRTGEKLGFSDLFAGTQHLRVKRMIDAAFRKEISSRAFFAKLAWGDIRVNYENIGIEGREYVFFCTMGDLIRHSPEVLAGLKDIARLLEKPILVRIPLAAFAAERLRG